MSLSSTIDYGYLYTREHESYELYQAVKLGIASNIPERDSQYATCEIMRGYFSTIIEIPKDKMVTIEKLLKSYFKSLGYHIEYNGGTEFFNIKILDLLVPFLKKLNINFKVLTDDEIAELTRINRARESFKKINKKRLIKYSLKLIVKPKPLEYQEEIIEKAKEYYKTANIGKLIWACGLGKTLFSLFLIETLGFKKILFGVPSDYLQQQVYTSILKLFPNQNNIVFVGGIRTASMSLIIKLMKQPIKEPIFIITTYASSYKLVSPDFTFDLKIGDEAHHLTGLELSEKSFKEFHKISSKKTLFMTATEKETDTRTSSTNYSMDDEELFGKYLDIKTIHWAIENRKITDYNVLLLKNTEDDIRSLMSSLHISDDNLELFMSAYMTLKSIEKYFTLTHVLIYTNNQKNAEIVKQFVNEILDTKTININKGELYNNALHSNSDLVFTEETAKFKNCKYGIISCVYIFGQGFDLPKLNGVTFAENMDSPIRIIQCTLRANRLDPSNPDKKSFIIIPYLDEDGWDSSSSSYEKVRKIIYKIRNFDENIENKIMLSGVKPSSFKKTSSEYVLIDEFNTENYELELEKIKLRLRHSKALHSKCSEEEDEYNYYRMINKRLGINSKKEYYTLCESNMELLKDPEEYFGKSGVWKGWDNFLTITVEKLLEKTKFRSKHEWISFCKEKNVKSTDDYKELCKEYPDLPINPSDVFKDFSSVSNELGLLKVGRLRR
jgi:predicted helicase